MHIDSEIKRAGTVNAAMEKACADFVRHFAAQGFKADGHTMSLHHLRVHLHLEAPHRVRIRFEHFWKARKDIPMELLVTDQEKVFWMNTATNREYISFDKALAESVEA